LRPTFTVQASDGAARTGRLVTAHGVVETPAFMPVGTYGTVKAMTPEELEGLGAQIIGQHLPPSCCVPAPPSSPRMAGCNRFMHWQHPILTDSGGFQVFSLKSLRRITEEGYAFVRRSTAAKCGTPREELHGCAAGAALGHRHGAG